MTPQVKPSARETRRLQTRQRLLDAAVAEFKRVGMAGADVNAIVAAAGVAHGTFFFHFPSKEHVLLELERHEEAHLAEEFARFLDSTHHLTDALTEVVHLVTGLEQQFGPRRRCGTSGGGCVLQRDVLLARHLRSAHDNRPCRDPRRDAAQARRIGRPGSGNPLVGQRKVSSWVISGRFFATSPRGAAPS